jgi:hypothetical protein
MIAQAVEGGSVERGTATHFVAEDMFVSHGLATREQTGAQPVNLLLDGVLLRVGHGRDPNIDGSPHHKPPVVSAARGGRLQPRPTTPAGVGGRDPAGQERRSAPRCYVAHANPFSSTPPSREISQRGVHTLVGV